MKEGKVCRITDICMHLSGIKGEGHEKLLEEIFKSKNQTEVTDLQYRYHSHYGMSDRCIGILHIQEPADIHLGKILRRFNGTVKFQL